MRYLKRFILVLVLSVAAPMCGIGTSPSVDGGDGIGTSPSSTTPPEEGTGSGH